MAGRIDISPEVSAYLLSDQLERAIQVPEHTEIPCFDCGGSVPPESDEALTLVLRWDPLSQNGILSYSHVDCSPSVVRIMDIPRAALAAPFTAFVTVLLLRDRLPAPLICEKTSPVHVQDERGESIDPYVKGYRDDGFAPSTKGLARLAKPLMRDWSLRPAGVDLQLIGPHGVME